MTSHSIVFVASIAVAVSTLMILTTAQPQEIATDKQIENDNSSSLATSVSVSTEPTSFDHGHVSSGPTSPSSITSSGHVKNEAEIVTPELGSVLFNSSLPQVQSEKLVDELGASLINNSSTESTIKNIQVTNTTSDVEEQKLTLTEPDIDTGHANTTVLVSDSSAQQAQSEIISASFVTMFPNASLVQPAKVSPTANVTSEDDKPTFEPLAALLPSKSTANESITGNPLFDASTNLTGTSKTSRDDTENAPTLLSTALSTVTQSLQMTKQENETETIAEVNSEMDVGAIDPTQAHSSRQFTNDTDLSPEGNDLAADSRLTTVKPEISITTSTSAPMSTSSSVATEAHSPITGVTSSRIFDATKANVAWDSGSDSQTTMSSPSDLMVAAWLVSIVGIGVVGVVVVFGLYGCRCYSDWKRAGYRSLHRDLGF